MKTKPEQMRFVSCLLDGSGDEVPVFNRYALITNSIRNTVKYRRIEEKMWNWSKHYPAGYCEANYEKHRKQLNKLISVAIDVFDKNFSKRKEFLFTCPEGTKLKIKETRDQIVVDGKLVDNVKEVEVEKGFQFYKNDFYKQIWSVKGDTPYKSTTILTRLLSEDIEKALNKEKEFMMER